MEIPRWFKREQVRNTYKLIRVRFLGRFLYFIPHNLLEMHYIWQNALPKEKLAFIITGAVLKDLGVTDADHIIHFDVSAPKKDGFADRHICMWGHFPNVLDYNIVGDVALINKVVRTFYKIIF